MCEELIDRALKYLVVLFVFTDKKYFECRLRLCLLAAHERHVGHAPERLGTVQTTTNLGTNKDHMPWVCVCTPPSAVTSGQGGHQGYSRDGPLVSMDCSLCLCVQLICRARGGSAVPSVDDQTHHQHHQHHHHPHFRALHNT